MSLLNLLTTLKQYEFGRTLLDFRNYLTADIVTKGLAFISIPVLTRLLSPADYGIVSIFLSYVGIFAVLFSLNAHGSVGRYFYEKKADFSEFFGSSISLTIVCLSLTLSIFLFFADKLSLWLGLPQILLYLLFPGVLYGIIHSFFRNIYIHSRESKKVATVKITYAYLYFALSVVIILLLDDDLYLGPILASVLTSVGLSIWLAIFLKPYFKPAFKKQHVLYILSYSVPQIPYILSSIILAQFDRLMINSYIGNTEAGLYSFAYNIGMLTHMVSESLFQAWMPDWFKYMDQENYVKRDKDIKKIIRIILLVSMFLMVFGENVAKFLADKSFLASTNLIPLIIIGHVFLMIFRVYGDYPQYVKKTYWLVVMFFASAGLNIILNAIFIPRYGYVAGAYTTVISYFLLAILGFSVAKYILKIFVTPLHLLGKPLAIFFLFAILLYGLFGLNLSIFWELSVKSIFIVIFVTALFVDYIGEIKLFSNRL